MKPTLKNQLDAFAQACRDKDLRLTPQRLEIFKELARATDHPTAEILHQRLMQGMPTLSLDTVYRTLGTFANLNLINRVETSESQAHFEVSHVQHHHLICRECKEIIDFHWQYIDDASLPEEVHSWGRIDRKNIVVYGTCHKCLKS
ncbi:MAG: Fur family transcriptional regulator [Thermodesulfobacteriota bacterium]|nr:Fur family transcriptional regulator [Thermodesulfobacteriota bacterium]